MQTLNTYCTYACFFYIFIIDTSCSSSEIDHKCVIAGSSPTLTFLSDWPVYHSIDPVDPFGRSSRIGSNATLFVDFQIHNATLEDKGTYTISVGIGAWTTIEVASK